jgi:chromatin segregation and condensation protein Rec8/ScpA/Scc1 (kleisin family)
MIGVFLALLELVRQKKVVVAQDAEEVMIELAAQDDGLRG